ncbi:hypothetical protein [Actinophytocola sp.]|uniref:hypothetical protein n=1 Tax=Actinophytocola sp. TaxID=1872138 RepID=UPI0025BBB863|nr:hypothetical protein [Actinophytocola sp.]
MPGRGLGVHQPSPNLRTQIHVGLTEIAEGMSVGELVERQVPPGPGGSLPTWEYAIDVSDDGGMGSLVLSLSEVQGEPLAAADE